MAVCEHGARGHRGPEHTSRAQNPLPAESPRHPRATPPTRGAMRRVHQPRLRSTPRTAPKRGAGDPQGDGALAPPACVSHSCRAGTSARRVAERIDELVIYQRVVEEFAPSKRRAPVPSELTTPGRGRALSTGPDSLSPSARWEGRRCGSPGASRRPRRCQDRTGCAPWSKDARWLRSDPCPRCRCGWRSWRRRNRPR